METKSGINFALKSWGTLILLTVSMSMSMSTGASVLSRMSIPNNDEQSHAKASIKAKSVTKTTTQLTNDDSSWSIVIGTAVKLHCPDQQPLLAVWNISLKNGKSCFVSYWSVKNETEKNCSENVDWVSRADLDSTLLIKSAQMSSEGIYECSVANSNGNFNHKHNITVLVPPEVSLTQDINGTAVCKANAGKPAAQITWDPHGDSSIVTENFPNGTETVTSIYNTSRVKENELICLIFHPAWRESHTLRLSLVDSGKITSAMEILFITLSVLLGILLLSVSIYLWNLCYRRQKTSSETKDPETISGQNNQENEMQQELEPYATFVQVENAIYDKSYDFSLSRHFPPEPSPSS